MIKKITIFTFLALIFLSLTCFVSATDNTNLGGQINDSVNQTGQTITNVRDAATNAGNNIAGAVRNTGNVVTHNATRTGTNAVGNTGYTATRTAAGTETFLGMNSTTWIWLILGVVALAIVFLSWYYMSDANKEHRVNND